MEDGKTKEPIVNSKDVSAVPEKLAPYFTEADLKAIARGVDYAESRTSGEIRVHISYGLQSFTNSRDHAVEVFQGLGMDKTEAATGLLLFLALKERRFEIIADSGIESRVPQEVWQKISTEMESVIHQTGITQGICHAIHRIGEILAEYLPSKGDNQDELSNEVSFEKPFQDPEKGNS